jgi:hypothetical protein
VEAIPSATMFLFRGIIAFFAEIPYIRLMFSGSQRNSFVYAPNPRQFVDRAVIVVWDMAFAITENACFFYSKY